MNDEIKKQEGGDGSTNLQGHSIVIHQGISYSDAKEIAIDVYKSNFIKLSEEAAATAVARATELTDAFLKSLAESKPESIESIKEPGM